MDEIKTKIDLVFEFVRSRKRASRREISRAVRLSGDEVDEYIYVLRKYGLIKVRYGWFDTYLYTEEDDVLKLVDEFKSLLCTETASDTTIFDKDAEVIDKNLKIMALRSLLE